MWIWSSRPLRFGEWCNVRRSSRDTSITICSVVRRDDELAYKNICYDTCLFSSFEFLIFHCSGFSLCVFFCLGTGKIFDLGAFDECKNMHHFLSLSYVFFIYFSFNLSHFSYFYG